VTGQLPAGRHRRDAQGQERARFVVRVAGPGDLSRVLDLHGGCPAGACPVREWTPFELTSGVTVLASRRDARGEVVAMACASARPGENGAWGLEVLVGEPWRGQGLGLAVATRAAAEAHARGALLLTATAGAGDAAMLALLGRLGAAGELCADQVAAIVPLPLPAASRRTPAGTSTVRAAVDPALPSSELPSPLQRLRRALLTTPSPPGIPSPDPSRLPS
jgi:GNAT superfamily N-acetyltransferase